MPKHLLRRSCCLGSFLLLTAQTVVLGAPCTLDDVPAATVLVPYFEVDLADVDGVSTVVHLYNAAPTATVAHVTFWTDWSVASIDFDLFLTGYDVVRLDLRDVFAGNIPITADEQSDPGDLNSPHGVHPEWDGSFPVCDQIFPFLVNPVITGSNLDRLVNGHTGLPVMVGGNELCFGRNYGDQVARGYLTIDAAVRCSLQFPSDAGYFGGADPVASNENQLWAEVWLTNPGQQRRTSLAAVHLEAMADLSSTFYSRYGTGGADARERLPTQWGAPAQANAAFTDEWIVWRDGGLDAVDGYSCPINVQQSATETPHGEPPIPGDGFWQPLFMNAAFCFDMQEGLTSTCDGQDCLGLETQHLAASGVAVDDGWCRLDLASVGLPDRDPSQAWVAVLRRAATGSGDAGAFTGTVLGGTCIANATIFINGFEAGDTSSWSATVGGAP